MSVQIFNEPKPPEEVRPLIDEFVVDASTFEKARLQLAQLGRDNFWWFTRYPMGMVDIDTELHHELCDTIQRWVGVRNYMILLPREHLKTSVATVGDRMWEAIKDANIRQLIMTSKLVLGRDILRKIMSIVETNEIFKWLYPEYCIHNCNDRALLKLLKWNSEFIDWPCKTKFEKESNIECASIEATRTGRHYNLLDADDIVDEENSQNREQRRKTYKNYLNAHQLGERIRRTRRRTKGTFWHNHDTYRLEIQKEMTWRQDQKDRGVEVVPRMRIYKRSCWNRDKAGNIIGSIWPEEFSVEELLERKHEVTEEGGGGSHIFSCQWELNPVNPENAIFQVKDIQSVSMGEMDSKSLITLAAVDMAVTDDDSSDFTAIVVCSFDEAGVMYVREILNERIPDVVTGVIRHLERLTKKWGLVKVRVETVAFQETLQTEMQKRAFAERAYIPWDPVRRGNKSKFSRWLGLQPLFERGDFYIEEGIPGRIDLVDQLLELTPDHKPEHDDLLDCLSDCHMASFSAPSPERPAIARDSWEALDEQWFGPMFDGGTGSRRSILPGNVVIP